MSSVRRIQTERLLEDVVRTLYSQGESPTYGEIASVISKYLKKYKAGAPLPLPLRDAIASGRSDVEEYNRLLSFVAINLDVLYEASMRQVESILELTSSMQTHLDRLQSQRKRIDGRITDYLLALYNTDGYFYSVSDNFSDITLTDLSMTSAHLDGEAGAVLMPSIGGISSKLTAAEVGDPDIRTEAGGKRVDNETLAPFSGALEDSLDNTIWILEVERNAIEDVVATITIPLGNQVDPVSLTRVDIVPYGSQPVQAFMEVRLANDESWEGFGNKIQTGSTKMIFGSNAPVDVTAIRITLRKTNADYNEVKGQEVRYKYLFGIKSLEFARKSYDQSARFVSVPHWIPEELDGDIAIDAVSLDVNADVPPDTEVEYYVGASTGAFDEEFDDINWLPIESVNSLTSQSKVVRFEGSNLYLKNIKKNPLEGDIELLPEVTSGATQNLNPNPTVIPGVDIWRIAEFDEEVLLNSLQLIEGVNTTKISWKSNAVSTPNWDDIDIQWWSDNMASADVTYGRIDSGNGFFYGGDVGQDQVDIYIETFLDADRSYPTFLDELQKADPRSRAWDVKVYLNGHLIGDLPEGTDKLQVPWTFVEGLNHVIVMVRIPQSTGSDDLSIGVLNLMAENSLYVYGNVRLSVWNYVDIFNMRYNETGEPRTFTMHEGEIVSRRKPTSNFQIRYAKKNETGPDAVRFRAEMTRDRNNPNVTPLIHDYRLRFSYGQEELQSHLSSEAIEIPDPPSSTT